MLNRESAKTRNFIATSNDGSKPLIQIVIQQLMQNQGKQNLLKAFFKHADCRHWTLREKRDKSANRVHQLLHRWDNLGSQGLQRPREQTQDWRSWHEASNQLQELWQLRETSSPVNNSQHSQAKESDSHSCNWKLNIRRDWKAKPASQHYSSVNRSNHTDQPQSLSFQRRNSTQLEAETTKSDSPCFSLVAEERR